MPTTKAKTARKDNQIRVRLTSKQKRVLIAAAQRAGLDVSSWLRTIGLREASRSQPTADQFSTGSD
ncbi:plasmid mobilization protein, partial [Escherichia coli]